MSKILFLNHAQMGHLNPLLTIALQMKKEGHKTEFLVPGVESPPIELEIFKTASAVPKLIQKAGLEVKMISPPICAAILSPILPLLSGYNEFMFAIELSSLGIKNYTYSILKHIEQNKPDALVTDFTFYSAYIAAEVSNIPCTTIYHSGLPFKGKIVPPFATGLPINENIEVSSKKFLPYEKFILSRLDRRINKARKHFGLSSVETEMLYRPYSKWLNLITSAEAIEAPRDNLTENTFFVGPCFEERKEDSSNFPFDKLDKDKYKIYISLGTVFNNKPKIFKKIIKALGNTEYQIIISAGAAYPTLAKDNIPKNILIFPRVPQIELLPKVDLVIGHGGNNTTNETLAAGKPLIILPIGGEQRDNGSRVEYLRVGLKLDIDSFTEEELKSRVETIYKNQEFQKRAKELKAELEKTNGAKVAAKLIQRLIEKQQPLLRPKNLPLTFTLNHSPQLTAL